MSDSRHHREHVELGHNGSVNDLEPLGLSPRECAAYELLVDSPPLTFAEFEVTMRRAGWSEAGPLLATLEGRGLATSLTGDPTRFTAVGPDVALDNLARVREREIANARLRATELTQRWLRVGRAVDPHEIIEIVVGRSATLQRAEQIQRTATKEVLMFDKPPYAAPDIGNPTELEMFAETPIRYRCLYDSTGFEIPGQYDLVQRMRAAGEEARVASALPMKMVMGDDRIAIVPLVTDPEAIDVAAVVHPSALLESLRTLFELLWRSASPLADDPPADSTAPSAVDRTDQRILDLLSSGLTDKSIARQLGVTERTVQRRAQRIMRRYGASNRLQLGIELGRRSAART